MGKNYQGSALPLSYGSEPAPLYREIVSLAIEPDVASLKLRPQHAPKEVPVSLCVSRSVPRFYVVLCLQNYSRSAGFCGVFLVCAYLFNFAKGVLASRSMQDENESAKKAITRGGFFAMEFLDGARPRKSRQKSGDHVSVGVLRRNGDREKWVPSSPAGVLICLLSRHDRVFEHGGSVRPKRGPDEGDEAASAETSTPRESQAAQGAGEGAQQIG
jgi:hypothetical protein